VFQVETTQRAHRAGLRVVELPFTFRDRTAGESKMKPGIALEGVRMVARLRRDGWRPQRVASAARTGA
jgi:dolichol-phosphate mannosyltransferase